MSYLRNRIDWDENITRKVMEKWEDLAADSDDDELAVAMLTCIEAMKATKRHADAQVSMVRRLQQLESF